MARKSRLANDGAKAKSTTASRAGGAKQPAASGRKTDTKMGEEQNLRFYKPAKARNDGRKEDKSKSKQAAQDNPSNVDAGAVKSRREIGIVTMNMNGNGVMGLTPKYKINMIQEFLANCPDIVFIQDSIEISDLSETLEAVSSGQYELHFQNGDGTDDSDKDAVVRSMTGVAWNKAKYLGTPLQLDDERLRDYVPWLTSHDLTVVMLNSAERVGVEDVNPSLIAISWHGPAYGTPLRDRTRHCQQFFEFLSTLRQKNWHIPILVGGDFNMDMKSFDLKPHYSEFSLVPYRPVSGTLAKDLKNTFVFTMDSLQVTETGFRQHHPETFPCPFISARVRGRNLLRIVAVVRIQRAVRRWLRRQRQRGEAKVRQMESKKRWRKKLQGDDYVSDHDNDDQHHQPRQASTKPEKKKKDRRYALYWDERDDPRYQASDATNVDATSDDYERRRRKDFAEGSTKNVMDNMYDKPLTINDNAYRRKRYGDLKSVQDRKREEQLHQAMFKGQF